MLATIMSFLLMVSLVVVNVSAAETGGNAVTVTFSGFPDDGWSCVFYDGSALSSTEISVEAGETIDLTGYSCSYPGYEFEGWYLTSDCSGEEITEITVNEDITVYAKLVSNESTPTALTSDGGSLSTGSYYLDGDVTLDADIEIDYGEEVTIDLNGYTLTGVESNYMFYVFGSLTIIDSSATENQEGTGTITGTGSSDYFICVGVSEEGAFTMNGGTITGNPEDWFLGVSTAGTFIMNGGTIACNSESHNVGVDVSDNGLFTMNGGTISGNGEYESVGAEVIDSGTFTMNGGTISDHYSSYGGVYVEGGTFVMNDGTITGNTAEYAGGGVYAVGSSWDDSTSTITMTGGTITGNTAENAGGGGVYIEDSTFTMTGGAITGNTAGYAGGGVCVYGNDYDTSTFTMTGGAITGNTSGFAGGGVFVSGVMKSDTSMFTMTGGTITGNTAGYAGGGVYVNGISESDTSMFTMTGGTISGNSSDYGAGGVLAYDSFTMTGGTISDNTATAYGGVYVYGTFNMSGSPVITGNTISDGTDTQTMNVYLEGGQWITLIGALTEGASIGVTSAPILEGYSDAQITSVEDTETGYYIGASGYFTSDNADCRIEENVYGFLRLYVLSDITGTVTVSGDPIYGQTLTTILDEDVPAGTDFQWMRDGEVITGATGSSYVLTADDIGKEITVMVTHSDYLGSLTATAGIIQKATLIPSISGNTEKVYDGTTDITSSQELMITLEGVLTADADSVTATADSCTYDSASAGTERIITARGITLSGSAAECYVLSDDTATVTGSITALALTEAMITVDTDDETYTGSDITKTIISDILTLDTDYTISYSDNTNVGTASITIVGIGNYSGTLTYSFIINKADQTDTQTVNLATPVVTISDIVMDKAYDGSPVSEPTVIVELANGDTDYTQTITYYDSEGNALTNAPSAPGNYQVVVTVDAGSNYEIVSVSESFTIVPAEQSISYSIASVEKTVGDNNFINELTQTLVYGEIAYESSDSTVATVDSNGEVTIVGVGTAVITATAIGSDNYSEATASYSLTVSQVSVSSEEVGGTAETENGIAETESSTNSSSIDETENETTSSLTETESSTDSSPVDVSETSSSSDTSVISSVSTGDSADMALWLTWLAAGAVILTSLFTVKRKKQRT